MKLAQLRVIDVKIIVIGSLDQSLINFRRELLRAMVRRGHRVIACAPAISGTIQEQLALLGVQAQSMPIYRTGLNPFVDLKTIVALYRFFRQEKPDRILAYTVKPVLYGSIAAWLAGVRGMYSMITGLGYVFARHDGMRHHFVAILAKFLYQQALRSNCSVFFQNPDDLTEFTNQGLLFPHSKTRIINGSGVDLWHYSPMPLPSQPIFLLIARLIAEKGIREYIQAAEIVKKKFPVARFLMAGWIDNNPSAITETELDEWQQKRLVCYLGRLEDVRPAIYGCRVYVLPSYREGTPRSVLEAMSMGRPIITTDVPGCRETVKEGINGLLVAPRDPGALAQAMMKFIKEPESAEIMGKASREMAEKKYDVHKVNDVILETMGI